MIERRMRQMTEEQEINKMGMWPDAPYAPDAPTRADALRANTNSQRFGRKHREPPSFFKPLANGEPRFCQAL